MIDALEFAVVLLPQCVEAILHIVLLWQHNVLNRHNLQVVFPAALVNLLIIFLP